MMSRTKNIPLMVLRLATRLGVPELTAVLFKTEHVMAELFPPGVRLVRPHTFGRGDALCDFQFCQIKQS